jgi:putative acetyltransferase
MTLTIRLLHLEDAPQAAQVFFDAVREDTAAVYTEAQRRAWAGNAPDPEGWANRIRGMDGFATEQDGQLVGFMTIDATGHIDLAFVAPQVHGQGVGWRLYAAIEARARKLGATALTTEASRMARPFFERQGWSVLAEQSVIKRDVALTNYRMRKAL